MINIFLVISERLISEVNLVNFYFLINTSHLEQNLKQKRIFAHLCMYEPLFIENDNF